MPEVDTFFKFVLIRVIRGKTVHKSFKFPWSLIILLTCASISLMSTPVLSDEGAVGVLTGFSGEVMIKSEGSWGVQPRLHLPLYSSDKVVTRLGRARGL